MLRVLITTAILTLGVSQALRGQIPTLPTRPGDPADTVTVNPFRIQPPISPMGALWRSILLPGWGQSILRRRVTGAFFVAWEGLTITMTLKSIHQLDYLRTVSTEEDAESLERVDSKEAEVQDWAILLAFNHLLAAVEAFVAAQLWDFPEELQVQAHFDGRLGLHVSIPLP
jgi:hypothetical protein